MAIFVAVSTRHRTEPVTPQGGGGGAPTMTSARRATQVVVTCQQLRQTEQGGFGIKGKGGLGPVPPYLCRSRANPAAFALHLCPSGKDLSRAEGAGALALSLM